MLFCSEWEFSVPGWGGAATVWECSGREGSVQEEGWVRQEQVARVVQQLVRSQERLVQEDSQGSRKNQVAEETQSAKLLVNAES